MKAKIETLLTVFIQRWVWCKNFVHTALEFRIPRKFIAKTQNKTKMNCISETDDYDDDSDDDYENDDEATHQGCKITKLE